MYRATLSCFNNPRFDTFTSNNPICIYQTCLNIFRLQPGVSFQKYLRRVPCGKHAQYVLYSKTASSDNWLATKDFWINCNSIEIFLFIHVETSLSLK